MALRVDRERCVGASVCISIAPEHMELDDEGIAVNASHEIPDDLVEELVGSCPSGALSHASGTRSVADAG